MLNGLDLFSGIGGLTLALAPWVEPIAYCENDRYAQAVLLSRMWDGSIPRAPIWDDVTTLVHSVLPGDGCVDIIYGGFPCQDISVAGRGVGLEGKRSGLVFEILRLVDELTPNFVFLENVPAIRTRGAERVVKELASRGYDCRWQHSSAASVGAPHLRIRWFLLAAHAERLDLRDEQRWSGWTCGAGSAKPRNDGSQEPLADALGVGSGSRTGKESGSRHQNFVVRKDWWAAEPEVGRVANGIPARVDRVRALGNAVVPLQAREAFKRLMGLQ